MRDVVNLPQLDDFLASIPLFSGMDPLALADLGPAMTGFSLSPGERLFAQNDAADGVYLVSEGALAVTSRTPGDGVVELSHVGPGGVIGEFCLLDGGRRSAEVRAFEPTLGYRLDLAKFAALRAGERPAAFEILDRLRREVVRRTRGTVEDISRTIGAGEAPREPGTVATLPGAESGDCAALLRTFPGFDAFRPEIWREFGGLVTRLEAPRGTRLEAPGQPARALYVVGRGAVRTYLPAQAGVEQLLVDGPGAIAGAAGLIDRGDWPLALDVREDGVLFAMTADEFAALSRAHSPVAYRMLDLIGQQLTRDLRRISRVRSRLEADPVQTRELV